MLRFYANLQPDQVLFIANALSAFDTDTLRLLAEHFQIVTQAQRDSAAERSELLTALITFYANTIPTKRRGPRYCVTLPPNVAGGSKRVSYFTDAQVSEAALYSSRNNGDLIDLWAATTPTEAEQSENAPKQEP